MAVSLPLVPTAPAPWIDIRTGQPTPEFYRFILSLVDMTINVLPIPPADSQALTASIAQVSPATVDALQNQVAVVQAFISTLPAPPPDLTHAVQSLNALLTQMPRMADLTDRVSKLEAIVYPRLV